MTFQGTKSETHPQRRARSGHGLRALILAMTLGALAAVPSRGDDITPGIDLFVTPAGATSVNLENNPTPPDLFGPGSEEFDGMIPLQGEPLTPLGDQIFPSDTIVERRDVATLSCEPPIDDTIEIELVALNLVSTDPITVMFGGGSEEEWDVRICVSESGPSEGTMMIRHECMEGGTFDSWLEVVPRYVFTRVSDGMQTVWDPGFVKTLHTTGADWVHVADSSIGALTATAPVEVDLAYCETDPSLLVPGITDPFPTLTDLSLPVGTSNFVPGIELDPCNCDEPGDQELAPIPEQDGDNAMHQVEPTPEGDGGFLYTIPTLAVSGLIAMTLLLVVSGAIVIRKRREAAENG